MGVRNLDKIFHPKRIAVVGASDKPKSVGATLMVNLIRAAYGGLIYPVNPKREAVHGVQTYANVASLPKPADLAVICTPAATVPDLIDECGQANINGIVILSAGFAEVGNDGKALQEKLLDAVRRYPDMRIIGPNCLGIIVPGVRLNASFAAGMPQPGHVAFVSQSGALATSILDWALAEQIGFSYFVSVGNAIDVGFGDLIDYFAQDPATQSIIMYLESVTNIRDFMSAARAFARTKPIVVYKAGRFAESAQAAASHTGAMAGEDAIYDAVFQRAGAVRVTEIDDVFDCAELLARQRMPHGDRLAIVTNAGGPGVMAADALLSRHGKLAALSEQTVTALNDRLPPYWSHGNPVDVLGDAGPERFADATGHVLQDELVDAILVVLTPQAMTDPTGSAAAVVQAVKGTPKLVLAAWMGGRSARRGIELLNQAGIPTYATPEKAVRAFMYMVSYARNKEILYETPRDVPVSFSLDRSHLHELMDSVLTQGSSVLSETLSKALLHAYEIPTTKPYIARSAADAAQLAAKIGFPVVLKVYSPQITHKTDVGGIELNLTNDQGVRDAFERIVGSAKEHCPDAVVEGVTVQQMVTVPTGFEMIVGMKKDPLAGAAILVGAGGITAELYKDRALSLPPLSERLARRMLESLRCWPILNGYRSRPALNVDQLIEVLIRLSYLVADYPQIRELDINPLLVTPESVVALDARIVVDQSLLTKPTRPFEHLAIRPYPEEFVRPAQLKDNTRILLRPIKPEDEPLWHEMLASCSEETIRFRFRSLFKRTTHEMATRFCFIDYDREIAIVAEAEMNGTRKLLGVGRLVADVDHTNAEYAVLVGDDYQGKGLGSLLTDYCLEICKAWGIHTVLAEIARDNGRMIAIFEHRGFQLEHQPDDDSVFGRKELT